jgi:hypothetical protein
VLDGVPVLGISVFAALDDIGTASLDGILGGKLSTYRVVHLVTVGHLQEAGFALLPTFGAPAHDAAPTFLDEARDPALIVPGPWSWPATRTPRP